MKAVPEKYRLLYLTVFFVLYFYFMEILTVLRRYKTIIGMGAVYILMFTVILALFCSLVSSLFGRKGNRIASISFATLAFLIFGTQNVYFTIFNTFTTLDSVSRAGDVLTDFWKEALVGIWHTIIPLLIILLPLVLFIVFGSRITPEKRIKGKRFTLLAAVLLALQIGAAASVYLNTSGVMPYSYVYGTFSPELSVPRFGILTTTRIEIRDMLFKGTALEKFISPKAPKQPEINTEAEPILPDMPDAPDIPLPPDTNEADPIIEYGDNVLEIDFDSLIAAETDDTIADMHRYFSSVQPTAKNEYTGMFEGKNLIWIVAEGFSSLAVDETHTPTLFKLSHEGFVFNNFYNPIWGVSTSDGEYTTLLSLIPKSGTWSCKTSSKNYLPFAFGNLMSEAGYAARAYHNHTYTYYGRDLSHPNMGYDYKGVGNGLEIEEQWPESDVEMMEVTVPEYVGDTPFHTYYMTVSGHLEYNFMGNMMAYKHKSEVQDMLDAGYSEAASAYVACQIELDRAMEYLIKALEENGTLEDTVIVLSGDHYAYGLTQEQRAELAGHEIESNFEEFRTTLMIWNSEMETVEVDKYCCSMDIMPTLANLFGLEYDSRLMMGRDIFSTAPPLIVFNNHSFITDLGRYNSTTDTFTPNDGVAVPEGYAAEMLKKVNDQFTYSAKILDNDYYAAVFPEGAVKVGE